MRAAARFFAVLVLACGSLGADAGWWDDAGAARRTTIEELRKDPDLWRDVTIVLDVRFARVAEPGNPYFTRFTARDWRALAVYADTATPEIMRSTDPFTRMFVRRGSECERRLVAATKSGRMQIRGAVRDAAKGEPWVEVFEVVADGDPLTPEEDAILARGTHLLAANSPAAAEALLRGLVGKRALAKPVEAEVWRKIGAAAWDQRRICEAADAFAASLAANPDDADTAARFSAARAALRDASGSDAELVAASGATPATSARRLLPPSGIIEVAPATQPPAPLEPPAAPVRPVEASAREAARPPEPPPAPVASSPPPPPPPSAPPPPPPPPPPSSKLSGPR